MPLHIEPVALLKLVISNPKLFPAFIEDISKTADKHLAKEISQKNVTLDVLRNQFKAVGRSSFEIAVDTLSDGAASSLSKRLDKHLPRPKDLRPQAHRKHVIALAAAEEEPTIPAPKTPKAKKTPEVSYRSAFDGPSIVASGAKKTAKKR